LVHQRRSPHPRHSRGVGSPASVLRKEAGLRHSRALASHSTPTLSNDNRRGRPPAHSPNPLTCRASAHNTLGGGSGFWLTRTRARLHAISFAAPARSSAIPQLLGGGFGRTGCARLGVLGVWPRTTPDRVAGDRPNESRCPAHHASRAAAPTDHLRPGPGNAACHGCSSSPRPATIHSAAADCVAAGHGNNSARPAGGSSGHGSPSETTPVPDESRAERPLGLSAASGNGVRNAIGVGAEKVFERLARR
jgi:hypothetical protein